MITSNSRNISKGFIVAAIILILLLLFWNSRTFLQRLQKVERDNMEIWAQSQKSFISENRNDYLELNLLIHTSYNHIPMMTVDQNNEITLKANIPNKYAENETLLKEYLGKLMKENPPIKIKITDDNIHYLYYGASPILTKLKYYPIAIVVVVLLLGGVVYSFFVTSKISEQNKLWAGMAKETAHQIGTPLSSLVGWTEILKTENVDPSYIEEMLKDIRRLEVITERFSKIGSAPKLEPLDIVRETLDAFNYLESRHSKLITFDLDLPENKILVLLNRQLYGWTIENLVKNGIDAMKGKGALSIKLFEEKQYVKIQVIDTGSGIPKRNFNTIFEPGYTTKTRGWGLGLSLARRIVEEYHNGRIKVKSSEKGVGTTFQISLEKL